MYSSLIIRVVVHTLDDVDLAFYRPIRTNRPERGPCTTARRHVNTVHNKEPASKRKLCLNADGIAVARNLRGVVDTHDSISSAIDGYQIAGRLWKDIRVHTRDKTQYHTHRGLLIDKLDRPVGRIAAGEEIPS